MKLPEYITAEEVRRVCKAAGLRDWTRLQKPTVSVGEAKKILGMINTTRMPIDPEEFRAGLDVEL